MHAETINCVDESAMQALGASLISRLEAGSLISLRGELGAGKSFLARAMIHAAGYVGLVKSPTYTLVETYDIAKPTSAIVSVAHLDLYRLTDPEELHYLGFDDVLNNNDLVMVEWPERALGLLPAAQLDVSIEYTDDAGRAVELLWA